MLKPDFESVVLTGSSLTGEPVVALMDSSLAGEAVVLMDSSMTGEPVVLIGSSLTGEPVFLIGSSLAGVSDDNSVFGLALNSSFLQLAKSLSVCSSVKLY